MLFYIFIFLTVMNFFLCCEFIEVTLVNKVIQVSGAQFNNTSSVHCVVYSPPLLKSPSTTIYPMHTLCPSPPTITMLLSVFMSFSLFFAQSSSQHPHPPLQLSTGSLSVSLSLFCLLVHFIHQIPHIVAIFFCHISLGKGNKIKNKQVGLYQTKHFLLSKGNHQRNEKTAQGMGECIC